MTFTFSFVMPGLDPGIHQSKELFRRRWMAGSSPAMTSDDHGTIVIGEKSTNQLFGCTTFLIFGLSARGATS
jgi:hypothetical protein